MKFRWSLLLRGLQEALLAAGESLADAQNHALPTCSALGRSGGR